IRVDKQKLCLILHAMNLSLRPSQSQRLRISQHQQLAFELLQMSAAELEEAIERETEQNPLLERVDGRSDPAGAERVSPEPGNAERSDGDGDDRGFDPRLLPDHRGERSLVAMETPEEERFDGVPARAPSLADHLEAELRLATDDADTRRLAIDIIGNLDDDGFLRDDLGEIAARSASTIDAAERALALVQGFDPPGIASRSLAECLLLQLR